MPESASERFARAVEGELVGGDLDEQLRRELAVVGALREVGRAARLDDVARQRMRRQLLAAAAERFSGEAEDAEEAGTADGQWSAAGVVEPEELALEPVRRPTAEGLRGRLLVAAAAALCLLMSLSAMSLLLARDALPGDPLYQFKRSAESAELGFTFGVEPRGFKHLQFATARVDEIEALAVRTSAGAPAADAGRYLTALEAFDADAAAGSRLLIDSANNGAGSVLDALGDWAKQQDLRIKTAAASVPERAAVRMGESRTQLYKIAVRAAELRARLPCTVKTSGARDEVGLLPVDGECQPAPVAPPGSQVQPSATVSPSRGNDPGSPDQGTQDPGSTSTEESAAAPLNPGEATDQPTPTPTAQVPPLLPAPDPSDPDELSDLLSVPLPILPLEDAPLIDLGLLVPGLLG